MEKKSISLKLVKNVNFPTQFCLGSTSNQFEKVFLKRNVHDFSVDYNNAIDKYDILNIHKTLMCKVYIK